MGLKSIIALSALASSAAAETVLGVYIFHRHGDRTPKALAPANLTSLGAEQCYQSGNFYRNRYVDSAASRRISGLSSDVVVHSQLAVTAPSDTVLQSSAQTFLQGLYPPAGRATAQKLKNGTTVEAPLGGYQYVPVGAATAGTGAATGNGAENNEWLQGGSGCGRALVSSNAYFQSADYRRAHARTAAFYRGLLPVINGTFGADEASFENAYTIFDLVNVATIHNQSIPAAGLLTDDALLQLRTRADQHEWGLAYNETEPVRAIAGAVLAGQMLLALNDSLRAWSASSSSSSPPPPRLNIQFGAYGTFMSFFGLAGLPAASPDFRGVADYASSMALELVTNATAADGGGRAPVVTPADVAVRFLFANGTSAADGGGLRAYPLFGGDADLVSWADFEAGLRRFAVSDTEGWCTACGNSTGICADFVSSGGGGGGAGSSSDSPGGGEGGDKGGNGISNPVAGVIGALVTLVVVLGIQAAVMFVAGLRLVKKGAAKGGNGASKA